VETIVVTEAIDGHRGNWWWWNFPTTELWRHGLEVDFTAFTVIQLK